MKKTVILLLAVMLAASLFTGCGAVQKETVTKNQAVQAVYASVGIEESDALYTLVTESEDTALPCYDVEILVDGVLYRYRIDAAKGDILRVTVNNQEIAPESLPKAESAPDSNYIGIDAAKAIAYGDAAILEEDVRFFEYKMDYALGQYLYDLEFETDSAEYEYEINALDGTIFKKDVDGKTVVSPPSGKDSEDYIGVTAAEDAALLHANVTRDGVIFEKTKWKMKKGSAVYDVEFVSRGVEYEYVIHALTAEVISHKSEGKSSTTEGEYIGESAAVAAALAHAGVAKSDARVESVEPDVKNVKTVYEVDFLSGGYEYEYVIDAVTGEVLDAEKDYDD